MPADASGISSPAPAADAGAEEDTAPPVRVPVAVPVPPPPLPAAPMPPAVPAPTPSSWSARARVPGALPPGAKATPPAPTQRMVRYGDPVPTRLGPPVRSPYPTLRRPGRLRRFFGALFALLLLLAVPVVSAYVSYKLASGENPFEWPPSVDLSHIF